MKVRSFMACHGKTRTVIAATARGFTLIELAVALVVVTLILGSILVPLTSQVEQRQISDTRKSLEEIKEALMGFAVANGYLPCPAVNASDGSEDRPAGVCNKRQGYIPWATLGVAKLDSWGHIFRYSVTPQYTSSAPKFDLTTGRDITIQTRYGGVAFPLASNVPALVLSHGKNGYGSVDDQGTPQALPADWSGADHVDENANLTPTGFFSRVPTPPGLGGNGGEFDDIVVWVSPNILFNHMVAAGKLP